METSLKVAEFIIKRYCKANKIVEVGVGKKPQTALKLSKALNAEIIVTDVKPEVIAPLTKEKKIKAIIDDVFNPNLEIYKGANLIYAIRPNPEVQGQVVNIALRVGADALLKTLNDEWHEVTQTPMKHQTVNYKNVIMHHFLNPKIH